MKAIKIFLLFVIFLLVQSCGDKEELRMELGGNYTLCLDGNYDRVIIDKRNVIVIESEVVAWNFDSVFIIAKQKPYHHIMDSLRREYPNLSSYSSILHEKFYDKIEFYHYWIIDKRKKIDSYYDKETKRRIYISAVAGTLTYEEYWDKRRELNVSDTLRLKEPDYYWFPLADPFLRMFRPQPMRELEHQ